MKDTLQEMWDEQAERNAERALIDQTAKLAQDIEWQHMATDRKLAALGYYLQALMKRAHANLVTPHEMRVQMAHEYGLV